MIIDCRTSAPNAAKVDQNPSIKRSQWDYVFPRRTPGTTWHCINNIPLRNCRPIKPLSQNINDTSRAFIKGLIQNRRNLRKITACSNYMNCLHSYP